jgi:glycosyltransferase involved in cell wall biosynthesis
VLLEAMAAGKAIVCSSRPPMPEFGGDALWYFDPAEPGELAGLALRLLRQPRTRARLGADAAKRGSSYDWDATARKTWWVLNGLAAAREL